MVSQILVLGTSGDALVTGKRYLSAGGILLKFDDKVFLLDPGPGCISDAGRMSLSLRELTAVFVSHRHLNHSGDLNAVISAMTLGGLDKKGVLVSCKDVILGEPEKGIYPVLDPYYRSAVEKFIVLDEKGKLAINDIDIFPTKTIHSCENLGFKFFSSDFSVGYTSDTQYSQDVAKQYVGCDVLIINVQNPQGISKEGLMNTDDCIKFAKDARPSILLLTHFGIKMINANIISQARLIKQETGVETIAAKDGFLLEPLSYGLKGTQKTLSHF
ncbi:MAG TPA: MBL fold metallo-hydrolase [Candidatus Woesearchaeota archaeon]|nr:MBL fold metallo-hydrolase [Candidatus Woesearchaeota archaeon]